MTSQLVALWALASWNGAMSRVDAQVEVVAAWAALLDLAMHYRGVPKGSGAALLHDASVGARTRMCRTAHVLCALSRTLGCAASCAGYAAQL